MFGRVPRRPSFEVQDDIIGVTREDKRRWHRAFRWNARAEKRIGRAGQSFGFMADEVERQFPDLVKLTAAPNGGEFKAIQLRAIDAAINAPHRPADNALKVLMFWSINGDRLGKIAEVVYNEYTARLFRTRNNINEYHAGVLAR